MGEQDYLSLLERLCEDGESVPNRDGVGSLRLFGERVVFDLTEGFPLLTESEVSFKAIAEELLWYISGDTNLDSLGEQGSRYWAQYADSQGSVGPLYGEQWRKWGQEASGVAVDQLRDVVWRLTNTLDPATLLLTAWNPAYLPDTDLDPCSNPSQGRMAIEPRDCMVQFHRSEDGLLDCQVYTTSSEALQALPKSIATYALLTHLIAQVSGLKPGRLVNVVGRLWVAETEVKKATRRAEGPISDHFELKLNKVVDNIEDFVYNAIQIVSIVGEAGE